MQENDLKKSVFGIAALAGITGAIVGGTLSASRIIKDIKDNKNEQTGSDAVKQVLKESAGSGLATAAGAAAAGCFRFSNPILSSLGFVGVTIGTKYLWDSATSDLKKDAKTECKEEIKSDNTGPDKNDSSEHDAEESKE